MQRADDNRRLLFLATAMLALGCTMLAGSVPGALKQEAIRDLNAFQPPSSTPFLPARGEPSPTAFFLTGLPPADSPAAALTIVFTLTGTDTPTPTLTLTILPSATLTAEPVAYLSPTITKSKPPAAHPSPTSKPQVKITLTGTPTPLPTPTATPQPTQTPTLTENPRSPTPSVTLTGSETAAPTGTETATPTVTPTATATPSITPTPTVTQTPPPSPTRTAGPTAAGCATFNFEWEEQVAVMINEERAEYGQYALRLDDRLTNSARAHSVDMVVNRFMSHTGSDGSTPQERERRAGYYGRYWGEIIGGGTPTIAVNWWMNEPGHRDMVLGTNWPYVDYGVGYAYCPGQGWFTVDFGAP
ncbi:MAG: CAP domain-containing protein [Anaerolineales bacterium]|nr:CAP domain-containing protein [Anaerolineales bacterium]